MNKTISILLFGALLASTACSSGAGKNQPAGETVTVVHSLDTVEVPLNPQRVVVLDFSVLENLDYLGIKPVGIPKNGLPAQVAKYKEDASVADVGTITEINLETIHALRPDLIFLGGRLVEQYGELSRIAPVILPEAFNELDALTAFSINMGNLGRIFGKESESAQAVEQLNARVEAVKAKTTSSDQRALILLHNRGRFSAYGSGSRFGIVHDVLGVREASEGMGTHIHGNPVSSEFVQQVNPDILFVVDRSAVVGGERLNREEVNNKLVQKTGAYRNRKIFYLNPEAWYLAGSGIISLNIIVDEVEQAF